MEKALHHYMLDSNNGISQFPLTPTALLQVQVNHLYFIDMETEFLTDERTFHPPPPAHWLPNAFCMLELSFASQSGEGRSARVQP